MPDGPRYDEDFFAWTQYQAEVLRTMRTRDNRFDREHVAEEVEDLGKSERDAMRSEVRRVIEHFLKLEYSPAADPRAGWQETIAAARTELGWRLTATLRRDVERELPRIYEDAKHVAGAGVTRHGEAAAAASFPADCPYTLDQVLQRGWYPEPAEKVSK